MEMTQVVFRVFPEGDVIALFPNEVWDRQGNIASYQRIGQHGGASPELITELKPASKKEYQSLKNELENHCGYKLEVI